MEIKTKKNESRSTLGQGTELENYQGGELLDIGIELLGGRLITASQFTNWCAFIKQRYSLTSAQQQAIPSLLI